MKYLNEEFYRCLYTYYCLFIYNNNRIKIFIFPKMYKCLAITFYLNVILIYCIRNYKYLT